MLRRVVGCMTGTSIDGIDAALAEIEGQGLSMRARFVRGASLELGQAAAGLRRLAEQNPMSASEIAQLMREFSLLHVSAARQALAGESCDFVCVHGQTVFHRPPSSWQLMQPAPIACELGVPVVYDLRAMDLASGGQGAPITPIADWVLFRQPPVRAESASDDVPAFAAGASCIANLGGFCNITILPGDGSISDLRARDVCACNQLLDEVARKVLRAPRDENGAAALRGTVHDEALEDLEGVLLAQSSGRRSLGTGDESGEWVSRWRSQVGADDLAATACEGIAITIAEAARGCDRLWLAGGGVHNAALVRAISANAVGVGISDEAGVPAAYREALCFAVLGALCQDRIPITLPRITGATRSAVSGSWAGLGQETRGRARPGTMLT